MNSLPLCIWELLASGSGCRDKHTHDYSRRKNALQVDLCWILGIGQGSDGTDVHLRVGNELFQFGEFGCVVIANELWLCRVSVGSWLVVSKKAHLVYNHDLIIHIYGQVIGLHDEVVLWI